MPCNRKIGPYDCCSVVQGDCLELMKALPDGCVDAVITSPPYVDQREYYGGFESNLDAWILWASDAIQHCVRVGGSAAVNVGDRRRDGIREWAAAMLYCELRRRDIPLWERFIWAKYPYGPNGSEIQPDDPVEFILWFGTPNFSADGIRRPYAASTLARYNSIPSIRWESDGTRKQKSQQSAHPDGARPTTVIVAPCLPTDEYSGHPAQFPIEIPSWFTKAATREGETILDPFFGSGTTAVAAKKLGRHFLGFEISEEYCRIARDRIARVEAQPTLFEPKAEQLKFESGDMK